MKHFLLRLLVLLAAAGMAAAQPYPTAANVVPADKTAGVSLNAHIIAGLTVPQGYLLSPLKLLKGTAGVSGSTKFSAFPAGVDAIFPVFGWVTFTPDKLLDPNATYTIQVDAPNRATYTSTFTTGATADTTPLRLVAAEPASGTDGINRGAPLVLHFSRPIDPLTLQNTPFIVQDLTSGNANTLVPVASNDGLSLSFPLTPGGYGMIALGHAYRFEFPNPMPQDWLGNTLAAIPDPISFTTFPNPAKDGPQFSASAPAAGDTGIAINSSILVLVDRPFAKLAYDNGVTLTANGNPVKFKLDTTIAGPAALVIQPSLLFPPNAIVALTINGLVDTFGIAQTSPFTLTFQTGLAPDATTLQLAFPQNPLLPRSAPVRATLSRPIEPATLAISSAQIYAADNYSAYETAKLRLDSDHRTLTLDTGGPLPAGVYRAAVNIPFDRIQAKAVSLPMNFTVTGDNDSVPPKILAFSPPDGQTDAPSGTLFQFVFSEPVVAVSLADKQFRLLLQDGTEVPGTFTLNGRAALFQPKVALAPSTGYRFQLTGLTDYSGNALPAFSASFTTAATDPADPFKVVSITPVSGSKGVDPDAAIVVTFNRAVSPASLYAQYGWDLSGLALDASTGAFTVSGSTVKYTPPFRLPQGTWGFSVRGATDLAGNVTAAASSLFDVAAPAVPDTSAPVVVSVSPADGQAVLFQSPYIILTFSKPLDSRTVTTDNFRLYSSQGNIQSRPSLLAGSTQVQIDFAAMPGALVTLYVNPTVTDIYGNGAVPFRSTVKVTNVFTPTVGASVVLMRPNGGLSPAGASIDLAFSAPVDRASVERGLVISASGVTVPGSVSWTPDSMILAFIPAAPLPYSANVEVAVLYPAQDAAANPISYDAATFQVEPAPPAPAAALSTLALSIVFPSQDLPLDSVVDILFDRDLPDGFVKPEFGKVSFGGWDGNGTPTGAYVDAAATRIRPRVVRIKTAAPLQPTTSYTFAFDAGPGLLWQTLLTTGTTPVTPAPTIVGYGPTGQAVALNAKIAVTFSNPVSPLALPGGVRLQSGPNIIPASAALSGQLVTLTPLGFLYPNADYTVVVSGFEDLAGHAIPDRSWTFHTTTAVDLIGPTILHIDPAGDGVSPTSKVSITFSKPVIANPLSGFSLADAGFPTGSSGTVRPHPLPGTLQFSTDQRVLSFTPAQPLPLGHLMQVVPPPITDFQGYYAGTSQSGNPVATFLVGYGRATTPAVTAVTPADGSTAMPLNARIQARFDQPVASSSLSGVALYENGTPVDATIVLEADGHTVTAVPTRLPSVGSTYRFVLAGVTSAGGGDPMAAPFQSVFRMGGTLDSVAPTCRAFPNPGQGEVPVGTSVRLYCSEPLNPLTVNRSAVALTDNIAARGVSVSLIDGGQTLVIVPTLPLSADVSYSVLAAVSDLAGNPVNSVTSFTTVSGLPQPSTTLVAADPPNGATAVPPAVNLQLLYNLPVDLPGGVSGFQLSSGAGAVAGALSVSNKVVSFQPTIALTPGSYHYQITGITDAARNTLAPVAGDFTVIAGDGTNLWLTGTTPPFGSVGVAINSPVTFTANEPFSAVSAAQLKVSAGSVPVSGAWATKGNTTVFTPDGTYPGASQVSVSGVLKDLTGFYVVPYVNFTTGANPDTTPFTMTSVFPADGSRLLAGVTNVLVRFSKPVSSVASDFVKIFVGSNQIYFYQSITISDDGRGVAFQLNLPADSDIIVTFGDGVHDFSGNPLAPVVLHYRTASTAESKGPIVSSSSPAFGDLNVDVNAHIQVTFTHPMVLTSVQAGLTVTNADSVIPGSITADSSDTTFDFAPSLSYQPGQSVEVLIANTIYDISGGLVQPFSWQFTTAALPGSTVHPVSLEVSTRAIDVRFDGPLKECPAQLYLHAEHELVRSQCVLMQRDQIRVIPETAPLRVGTHYVLVVDADQELPLQVPAAENEPSQFVVESIVGALDGIHVRFTKRINTVTARAGIRVRNAAGMEIPFSILTAPGAREIVIAAAPGAAAVELDGLESRAGDVLPKFIWR